MGDVGADEDRGNGAVKVVEYVKGLFCFRLAALLPNFQLRAGDRGEGRFRHGEIRRKREKDENEEKH